MEGHTIATYLLTLVIIFLFYIYWYFQQIYKHWEKRKIPYLKPTMPFGNLLKVYCNKCQIGEVFAEIYYELKKMGVKLGGAYFLNCPVYIPIDPTIIKHILVSDANNFIDHGFYKDDKVDPLSTHIFNMEGMQWKGLRTKISNAYTIAKLKKMLVTMVDVSREFEKHLELCSAKQPEGIHVKDEIIKLTADTIMRASYGMETNMLRGDNEDLLKHLKLFAKDQWTVLKNSIIFLLPRNILHLLKFRTFSKERTDYVRKLCVGLLNYRKENNVNHDDLTDILISLTEKNENQKKNETMKPLTENEFVAQMWVFLAAGSESSATTISFALYELSKNPDCQTKLREEITSVLAKHNNELSYEAFKEMYYLDNVVNETLRLYPILPMLFRLCASDYKVPDTNFVMEKNTLVVLPIYGIQRDPDYYPQPSKFDPDRFTPENKAKRTFVSHMTFGDGPRICPGKQYALLQVKVGLIAFVKNYVVSLSDKTEQQFNFAPWHMILRKTGGIWMKIEKIK